MKKLFTLLLVLGAITAYSQTDIGLGSENIEAPSGTLTEIDIIVTTEGWNNITSSSGTITWDPAVVSYSSVTYYATLGNTTFGDGDITVSQVSGTLAWDWNNLITIGGSLGTNAVFMTIEFDVIGNDGDTTAIGFSDSPETLSWFSGFGGSGSYDGTPGQIIVGGLNLTGCYDPQFWTGNTANTNGTISHESGVITMTGDNDGTGNGTTGVDCDGTEGTISYCNTIPNDGEVSFDWDYSGVIDNADSDALGYCLNGTSVQLAQAPPPFGGTPFGTATFDVIGGDELCFVMSSESADLPNAPIGTISNFSGPDCELPVLSASIELTSPVVCNGDENASLEVTIYDETGDVTYSWDVDGVEGANPTGLGAGEYCVTVIDAVPDTFTTCFTITEAPVLTASAIANPDNGTGTGMALATVNGGQPFPQNPTYSVTWNSDPVQTGLIANGLPYGVYEYTVVDALGCTLVNEIEILYVGIEEITGLDQFNYYPNPAEGSFIIDIAFNENKEFNLSIVNSVGQSVLNLGTVNGSQYNETIDITSLTTGFYFLNVEVDGYRITRKLTVK